MPCLETALLVMSTKDNILAVIFVDLRRPVSFCIITRFDSFIFVATTNVSNPIIIIRHQQR